MIMVLLADALVFVRMEACADHASKFQAVLSDPGIADR